MRRRVRLTEGQLRNVVEEASRRVIQEMMNEGLFTDFVLDTVPQWYNWWSNTITKLGSNTQNNGAMQFGTVNGGTLAPRNGAALGGTIGAINGAVPQNRQTNQRR